MPRDLPPKPRPFGAASPPHPSAERARPARFRGSAATAPGQPASARHERPRKPPLAPQVTTLWDYPSQHYGDEEQGSQAYRGATPSYVIWNVVHRFTSPGERVVDPFVGSGTTLDVCADLGREALGFDLQATRPEVRVADARSLPLSNESVDLVFMDPPYADNLEYSSDPRCIGKLKADGRYQRAMRLVLSECKRVLRPGRVLAVYVCDVFKKGRGVHPLGFELFAAARELGFHAVDIVAVVRHNRTLSQGNYRKAADEEGFFLRGFNYLLLLRKPERTASGIVSPTRGEAD